ncbi:MAG: prolipoprotein diacylglyceryl transferase [Acidobacteria bacterium]|nr:prolipoprotein diacylglyceryl transferase [Acidobacteriota bacterium]
MSILFAPAAVAFGNYWLPNSQVHLLTVLAAASAAYALGEGVGRLSCISFGCCYGKPLAHCHPLVQRLFARHHFIFSGKTKKIAYAQGLDGQRMMPIQAITALIYSGISLVGFLLLLKGRSTLAFLLCNSTTQIWRAVSECYRSDYRGAGKISAYQMMAIFTIAYGFILALALPASPPSPGNLWIGLNLLFFPGILLFFQGLWVTAFLLTGRSAVTASSISFYVVKERI